MVGKQYVHGLALDAKYGEGTAKEIYHRSNQLKRFTEQEYTEMISLYRAKVNALKRERNME
jgi:transcription elongation factor GreA-like protein